VNQNSDTQAELRLTRREALQGIATVAASSLFSGEAFASTRVDPQSSTGAPAVSEHAFSDDWRFHRGDPEGGEVRAEAPGFDDSEWRTLDVPHDWSIEDLPGAIDQDKDAIWTEGTNPVRVGPFDAYASEGQISTGWVVGGVGWYRKTFQAPQLSPSGKIEIRFEGVYMNAEVWLNGTLLGKHPYGYTGFAFDLTPHLKTGANTIAVRVSNTGRNSRWYSGSGIFRKVWLSVAGPVRISQHGIYLTTPDVSKASAVVKVETTIENGATSAKSAIIRVRLVDSQGAVAAETQTTAKLAPNTRMPVTSTLTIKNPRLWSPSDPQLYRAEVSVESDRTPADAASVTLGLRKVEVDAAQGLRINGESMKLKGGCVHHDNGPLGSACIPRGEERRVEILKANGYNAIRTSHNPPSRDFLDACDRVGMLVIDEAFDCWTIGKNPEDYHLYFNEWWQRDIDSMVLRDRNHPSVIFWSIGNEIPERAEPKGVELGKQLAAYIRKLDATRPVTAAICGPFDHPKQTWKDMEPAFTYLDIGGYNYQWKSYAPDHEAFAQRVMMGTESFPNETFENWAAIDASPWVIGDFVWTAIDYLGESGIGHSSVSTGADRSGFSPFYPWFNSYCGDIDLIGNKKPQSYFRDVVWNRSKIEMAVQRPVPARYTEHISRWGWSDELRSWTWPGLDGTALKVRVYTRGDEVRVFLNGKQVGQKQLAPKDALTAEFDVPYAAGELKAVALLQGSEIGTVAFNTAGKPARLMLTADRSKIRANRDDLAYVMVTVVDDAGRTVPDATIPVTFSFSGSGELAAVGNANPKDVASFRQPRRSTYHGTCLAVLRSSGESGSMNLKAEAPGFEPASIVVKTA
jgi:beta-galactosidase